MKNKTKFTELNTNLNFQNIILIYKILVIGQFYVNQIRYLFMIFNKTKFV